MIIHFFAAVIGAILGIYLSEVIVGKSRREEVLKPYKDDITTLELACSNLKHQVNEIEEQANEIERKLVLIKAAIQSEDLEVEN